MADNNIDRFNGVLASLAVKTPCVAAALVNITLSGEQTVNGVAVVADNRVLCTAQTLDKDNGIYVASTTAWSRAADFDGNRDAIDGTLVVVASPSLVGFYQLTATNPVEIGQTELTFTLVADINLAGNLALTTTGQGASLIGVEDAAGDWVATTVEAVLVEIATTFGVTKVKTATKTLANTTALENDDHLFGWSLVAGKTYIVEGFINYLQNVGNIQMKFNFTNAPEVGYAGVLIQAVDITVASDGDMGQQIDTIVQLLAITDGSEAGFSIHGAFKANSSVGGTVDYQWAQETNDGVATQMFPGSWITIRPID